MHSLTGWHSVRHLLCASLDGHDDYNDGEGYGHASWPPPFFLLCSMNNRRSVIPITQKQTVGLETTWKSHQRNPTVISALSRIDFSIYTPLKGKSEHSLN